MRAEVMPKPELPGHAILRVHDLDAPPDGLVICIERRQGPEKYLSDAGWQRSETWLAPERIQPFGGGIDFHVGPVVCDMVAGLTVRLSIREQGGSNIGATVVAWPTMQTSGAYDPNRMVTGDMPAGTDRGFATGSAPTTIARLPDALQVPPQGDAPPTQIAQPIGAQDATFPFAPQEPPPPFQPEQPTQVAFGQPEPPPPFQFDQQQPPPPFQFDQQQPPPPFQFGQQDPAVFDPGPAPYPGPGLGVPDPARDRIGPETKKSSAGLWVVLSIVLAVALLGGGAAAYWWFEPCGFCTLSKQVGLDICSRCGRGPTDGPTPEEVPERVVADRFIKTNPPAPAAVEKCRDLVKANQMVAAFLVCRHAAEAGDPVGAGEYAAFFDPVTPLQGSPIPPDGPTAAEWYEKAVRGEHPVIMARLGKLYAKGADNLPADKAKGCEWLVKAADKGEAEAKRLVAELQCR